MIVPPHNSLPAQQDYSDLGIHSYHIVWECQPDYGGAQKMPRCATCGTIFSLLHQVWVGKVGQTCRWMQIPRSRSPHRIVSSTSSQSESNLALWWSSLLCRRIVSISADRWSRKGIVKLRLKYDSGVSAVMLSLSVCRHTGPLRPWLLRQVGCRWVPVMISVINILPQRIDVRLSTVNDGSCLDYIHLLSLKFDGSTL